MRDKIVLDLNNPVFLDTFFSLDPTELGRVAKALKRIQTLDWPTFIKHKGSRWEAISHIQAPTGRPAHSFRLSQKYRALAYRDGAYLRILSLHLDHHSAYV